MKSKFNRLSKYNLENVNSYFPVYIAFLIAFVVVIGLSLEYYHQLDDSGDFVRDILIEGHGMLLDIIVFGFLIQFISRKREKNPQITQMKKQWKKKIMAET